MIKPVMQAIFDKIKEADKIMLFRHIRPDGDCVGATKGLQGIIRCTWPEKQVLLIDYAASDYLAFLGADDGDVSDDEYRASLGIVIDTGNTDRISNPKFALCRELIKIDHHIEREPYGTLNWVEDERSSACEMIAAFYAAFRHELNINSHAATCLYTGMVTDSGRFKYEGVAGDTLRLAALLLEQGVDAETLYAHLYLRDYDSLKFKAHVYQAMQRTENGVAYVYIDGSVQERFGLSLEDAGTAVGYLDNIKGCLCWLAFIDNGDGSIRVRLRSRFMNVSDLAEKYHGGGHLKASGATVYSEREMQALIADADALVAEYKQTHQGWL